MTAWVSELPQGQRQKMARLPGLEPGTYGLEGRCTPDVTADKSGTYAIPPEALGRLLGAFAAEIGPSCPDLAAVVSAWPRLPEALKTGIVAMVKAARGKP